MSKERVEYEVVGRDVGGSKAFRDVGDAADKAGDKVDKAGDQAGGAAKEYRGLAADIELAQAEMKRLAVEISKTGNMDLVKDLRRQRSELRKLLDVSKLAGDVNLGGKGKSGGGLLNFALDEWAAKAGRTVANGLESGIQSAGTWASSNPWIATAIAGGIALGTPIIGGAVTAAIGGGVIAGGIILAAQDPRVGQAWKTLGEGAKGKLTGAADVFVAPLIRGTETFGSTLNRILPNLKHDFASLAPVSDKLFAGAAGFLEELMPGIDALTTQAGPTLTMVADELPRMGAAVSQMMEAIASGGEGGRQALHDLLVLTEAVTVSTGNSIAGFEKWYQAERSLVQMLAGDFGGARKNWENLIYGINDASRVAVGPAVKQTWATVTAVIGQAGQEAHLTADQLKELSNQLNATTLSEDILAGQMTDKLLGSMMSIDQAALGFAESQTRISESIKDNGRQLDIHTVKGQANRESILGAVQANISQYDALIRAGGSAAEATAAYDTNTAALEAQLRQAGFTQEAIDGLIGKYRNVPAQVNTEIAMDGLASAIQSLDDAIRKANNLDGRVVTTYYDKVTRNLFEDLSGHASTDGHATGGLMRGPGTGTSDDIVTRVSNGEYVVRAAAASALGVGFLDRINQADRNPAALSSGGGASMGSPSDLSGALEQAVVRALSQVLPQVLSRATLRIDDRTGRIMDLYSRAG